MNYLCTLIPYASYKYHIMAMTERERETVKERVVYLTAPCDHPISVFKSPDRSNTVNPACRAGEYGCYHFTH